MQQVGQGFFRRNSCPQERGRNKINRKKIIIGLTGKLGSGKGTVAGFLAQKGFFVTSLSDRVREEIRFRGLEVSRDRLLAVSDELRRQFGPEVLAQRTLDIVLTQENRLAILDSIRGEAEVDFLKKQPRFILIGVTAPPETCFERIKARGRESDPQTLAEFLAVEEKDVKSGQGKVGRDIEKCLEKSDFLLDNTGTLNELNLAVDKILKKILD